LRVIPLKFRGSEGLLADLVAAIIKMAFRDIRRAHNREEPRGVVEWMHGHLPYVRFRN
jgi:hypothetical protein